MENKYKILIVEDDKNAGFLLKRHLTNLNFGVMLCVDGEAGMQAFKKDKYDLCILDIMLPKKDGIMLAKEIREFDEQTPFVFLTARNLKSDKITGYNVGCDDYISKPFDIDEFVFKINVILRRTFFKQTVLPNEITVASFVLKTNSRILQTKDKTINLSNKEALLLELFFKNINKVVSRSEIMREVWGNDDFFTSKNLDVYLTKLRKILHSDSKIKLLNVYGFGYKLVLSGVVKKQ